jgi:hypothetical protein
LLLRTLCQRLACPLVVKALAKAICLDPLSHYRSTDVLITPYYKVQVLTYRQGFACVPRTNLLIVIPVHASQALTPGGLLLVLFASLSWRGLSSPPDALVLILDGIRSALNGGQRAEAAASPESGI